MASQAAKAVAQEVLGTLGKGKRPNITKIAISKGYTPKTANSGAVQATQTYKEIAPLITRLEQERDAIVEALKKKRGKAKYRDLIDGLDKVTKNLQLLTGGATANIALGVKRWEMMSSRSSLKAMAKITPQEAKKELAKRELARRRLSWFVKYNFEGYKENWHHKLITDKLEAVERGEIRKLMIFVPPRHGKSEIASINFPAWFFGRNPKKSIIAASYNSDLAVGFGRKARNIVDSQEFKNLFNDVSLAEDSKAAGQWNISYKKDGVWQAGGEYTAVGIGGGTTGRGADIFIIDDPVKDKQEAESSVIQERNIGWFRSVATTRLTPGGAMVVIQTRWHDMDLAGMILADEDDWEVISLPAIAEQDEEHRVKGDPLWPDQYSLEELEAKKKSVGTEVWASLYQQSPISEESQVFTKAMFKKRTMEEVSHLNTRCFVTIDPAPGKTENADFIGICINFVDSENFWNLIAYRIKFDAYELIKLFFKLNGDYHVEKFGIEKGLYKDVLKPFLDREMIQRNKFLTIEELDHEQKNKHLRIKGLQPRYEAGGIFHIEGMCADLEEELLRFPKAAKDDVSDATAYQSKLAEAPENKERRDLEIFHKRREQLSTARDDVGLTD